MARATRLRQSSAGDASALPRPALIGLCLLTSFATGILLSITGPTVPAIAARLHLHESDLGIVFGANFLTAALTTPLAGRIFDSLGARLLFPLGLAAMALGALGEGAARSLPLLTAAGALAGLGIGINTVCNNVTASALVPARSEAILNGLNAFFGAGAFLAPLLAGFYLTRLADYTPVYLTAAVLLALPALPLWIGLPRGRMGQAGDIARARTLLAEPLLWAHAAISFFYLGAEIGFGGWVVAVLQHTAHLSPAAAAPVAALYWLFLALGGLPTAYLLHHGTAPARIITAGALGAALAAALFVAFSHVVPVAVVAAALIGLSFSPILPLNIAAAVRVAGLRAPGAIGGATALVLMCGQMGAAALPPVQGLLLGVTPGLAVAMTCVCSLLMLGLQRAITRP